jgi:2-oxo-hept-3-ene-1,7-dioate hydratase
MLTEAQIKDAAARLDRAEQTRTLMRQLTIEYPALALDEAYAIQRAWIDLKLLRGRTIRGRKIGLTSRAMQQTVNITEPDYGVLLDDMFYQDGASIPTDRFIAARVEAELAFVLKQRLSGPHCTIFQALDATDYVVPALEILDSRLHRVDPNTKSTRKIQDTISDNAAHAAVVVGGRPFRPLDVDLRWISALCFRNGQIEETGVAAGVLNHPANAIAWLANKLAAHGVELEPGQLILSGSFIRPIDAHRGDTFHADYGLFGSVSCFFE